MTKGQAGYYSLLAGLAAAGAAAAELLGGWDSLLQILVTVMGADFLLGTALALVWKRSPKTADGRFESRAGAKGLFRKCGVLLCVLVAARLDVLFGGEGYVRTLVILFFLANEGFSVLENLGAMGLPLPPALKNAFAALAEKSGALGGEQPPAQKK
ncbi:MAG TPA: phage holin family protein [Candidatus Caccousia avistercoris]|nr:phage holin family protein [Candidatus Caccousia avistercoris]